MDENKYDILLTESQLRLVLTALEEYTALRSGDFSGFVDDIAKEGKDPDEMTEFERTEYLSRKDEYEVRMAISFKNICKSFIPVKTFLQRLSEEMAGIIRFYFYCNGKIKMKQRYPLSYTKQPFLEITQRKKGYLPTEGMPYFTPSWTKDSFYVKKQLWTDSMDDRMRYKLGLVYPAMADCDINIMIDIERVTGRKIVSRKVIVDNKMMKPERNKNGAKF